MSKGSPRRSARKRPLSQAVTQALEPRWLFAITVNTAADTVDANPAVTSLREAITQATTTNGDDQITFDATVFATPQTITLGSGGQLNLTNAASITGALTITGPGANLLTVSGNDATRVFALYGGSTSLSGLTITHGKADRGGGLRNIGATLTLTDAVVTGNTATDSGGGIYCQSSGSTVLVRTTLSSNTAGRNGGGAEGITGGSLALTDCTVTGNTAVESGGGFLGTGPMTVTRGVIYKNTASRGGGIRASGSLTLSNATVANNTATDEGGGIFSSGPIALTDATVSGNAAPASSGLYVETYFSSDYGGYLRPTSMSNTVVAGNTGSPDLVVEGNGTFVQSHNFVGGDPKLGELKDNDGLTLTMRPTSDSPLINAGDKTLVPAGVTTDQRGPGFVRLSGTNVDIGAFEQQDESLVVTTTVNEDDGTSDPTVGAGTSLREAINYANAKSGADAVTLAADTTYTLAAADNFWYGPNGLPAITSDVTIEGNGATIERATAEGTPAFRLFYVAGGGGTGGATGLSAGALTLKDVTLAGGLARGGNGSEGGGGGLGAGGAVFNQGTLTVNRVLVLRNTAQGGTGGGNAVSHGGGGGMGGDGAQGSTGGGGGGGMGGDAGLGFAGGGGGGGITGAGGGGGINSGAGGGGFPGDGAGGGSFTDPGGNGGGPNPGAGGAFDFDGGHGGPGGDNSGGGGGGGGDIGPLPVVGRGGNGGKGGFGGGGGGGGSGGDGTITADASIGGDGGFGGGGGGAGFSENVRQTDNGARGGDGGTGGGGGGAGTFAGNGRGGDGGFGGGGGKGNQIRGGNGGFGGGGAAAQIANAAGTSAFAGGAGSPAIGGTGGGGAGLGGAIFNDGGTVTVVNATFTENTAVGGDAGTRSGAGANDAPAQDGKGLGGAIFSVNGTVDLRNSTLSKNNADAGRGVYARGEGGLSEVDGSNNILGQADASVTDVEDSFAIDGVSGSSFNMSASLIRNSGNITGGTPGDPMLEDLDNNGGFTRTMALRPGSPALNVGDNGSIPAGVTTDQRGPGFDRIIGGIVDIGAFESAAVGPAVTRFFLVNAVTDQDILELTDGLVIDPATLPTSLSNLNVRAEVAGGVGSVRFGFDGDATFRLEKEAPFALFGDNNGNFAGKSIGQGTHTLTATPFVASNGQGTSGAAKTVGFRIQSPPPTGGSTAVTRFFLVNATTDQDVFEITEGMTIDLSTLPTRNVNVRAETSGTVGSVRFGFNGNANFKTENDAPFALFGDSDGDFKNGSLSLGGKTLTATPFANNNGGGLAGTALTVNFTVVP